MKEVKKVELSGAEAIGKAMKECGVDYFFYVMGGMMIYSQIENAGVKTVLCRNEKSATNMADGYARVTKKPTVCYSQHGAAAAILASMLYEPMFAHSPVIALTGSYPTKKKDMWSYQECYEMKYFEQTCKFNVDVTDVHRLAEYMRTAVQMAVSGCPGPTHMSMHTDMAQASAQMPEIYGNKIFFKVPPFRPRAEPERIAEAAKLLADAEKPVMVCGSGIHLSGAYEEVQALAELLTIPVTTNPNGKGCFPDGHPLHAGVMGTYGRVVANEFVREADLIFFVATRAGRMQTEEFTSPVPGTSKIIHLDIDPAVMGRNYRPDVALVGDAKTTLQDLLTTLNAMIAKPKHKGQRIEELAKAIKEYEKTVTQLDSDAVPIKPQRLMTEVSKFLGPRDIVVSDTGNMLSWTSRFLRLKETGMLFLPVGGTLGSSFALAIGASFGAEKDQRILHLTGDGGMGYNLVDLETAKRYNDLRVPMVTVVNNNSILGSERFPFTDLNYAKIAEAFGCHGERVERPGEIIDALHRAFDSGKPAIVDVVTDKTELAPLRVRYLS
jgi:acetolactate synthase-1/2/3 large subunit